MNDAQSYVPDSDPYIDAAQNDFANNVASVGWSILSRTENEITLETDDPYFGDCTVEFYHSGIEARSLALTNTFRRVLVAPDGCPDVMLKARSMLLNEKKKMPAFAIHIIDASEALPFSVMVTASSVQTIDVVHDWIDTQMLSPKQRRDYAERVGHMVAAFRQYVDWLKESLGKLTALLQEALSAHPYTSEWVLFDK